MVCRKFRFWRQVSPKFKLESTWCWSAASSAAWAGRAFRRGAGFEEAAAVDTFLCTCCHDAVLYATLLEYACTAPGESTCVYVCVCVFSYLSYYRSVTGRFDIPANSYGSQPVDGNLLIGAVLRTFFTLSEGRSRKISMFPSRVPQWLYDWLCVTWYVEHLLHAFMPLSLKNPTAITSFLSRFIYPRLTRK